MSHESGVGVLESAEKSCECAGLDVDVVIFVSGMQDLIYEK